MTTTQASHRLATHPRTHTITPSRTHPSLHTRSAAEPDFFSFARQRAGGLSSPWANTARGELAGRSWGRWHGHMHSPAFTCPCDLCHRPTALDDLFSWMTVRQFLLAICQDCNTALLELPYIQDKMPLQD